MRKVLLVVVAAASVVPVAPAAASHSWNGYHWARTANPFTLMLGDNLTATWEPYYTTSAADWSSTATNAANPLRAVTVAGGTTGRKCRPTSGRVEVCNAAYGKTGWLGVAQIWASGSHITQGTAKMNDTYYATGSKYDTPIWRGMVMCQEVGHTFGLDHQDTSGADLHTCMDYAAAPDADNTKPNAHDYDELVTIYSHLDATSTLAGSSSGRKGSAGRPYAIRRHDDRRSSTIEELYADGSSLTTFIVWAT